MKNSLLKSDSFIKISNCLGQLMDENSEYYIDVDDENFDALEFIEILSIIVPLGFLNASTEGKPKNILEYQHMLNHIYIKRLLNEKDKEINILKEKIAKKK